VKHGCESLDLMKLPKDRWSGVTLHELEINWIQDSFDPYQATYPDFVNDRRQYASVRSFYGSLLTTQASLGEWPRGWDQRGLNGSNK